MKELNKYVPGSNSQNEFESTIKSLPFVTAHGEKGCERTKEVQKKEILNKRNEREVVCLSNPMITNNTQKNTEKLER